MGARSQLEIIGRLSVENGKLKGELKQVRMLLKMANERAWKAEMATVAARSAMRDAYASPKVSPKAPLVDPEIDWEWRNDPYADLVSKAEVKDNQNLMLDPEDGSVMR